MLAYAGTADTIGAAALAVSAVGMLIYAVRTGPPPATFHRADRDPVAHVRPVGPVPRRPFDWELDDPDLGMVARIADAFDVPVDLIVPAR